jgi:serine/threonine-protein kinase
MPQPGTVSIIVSAGPNAVSVPDVIGRSIDDARLAIEQAGLVVGDVSRDSGDAPGGVPIVVSQSPAAGSRAPAGTAVTMRVSGG